MLLRYDPFRELDRAMDGFFDRGRVAPSIPMDAVRHDNQVFISFDLPGVDPESIDLTVERNILTVRAERAAALNEGDTVLADERPKGSFARRVLLGDTLDGEKLEASYDHGVLTVSIPVAEQAKPRRISVNASGSRTAIDATSTQQTSA